jgi:hypothetical protein
MQEICVFLGRVHSSGDGTTTPDIPLNTDPLRDGSPLTGATSCRKKNAVALFQKIFAEVPLLFWGAPQIITA